MQFDVQVVPGARPAPVLLNNTKVHVLIRNVSQHSVKVETGDGEAFQDLADLRPGAFVIVTGSIYLAATPDAQAAVTLTVSLVSVGH